jgi:hypothetical protein
MIAHFLDTATLDEAVLIPVLLFALGSLAATAVVRWLVGAIQAWRGRREDQADFTSERGLW